MESAAAAAAEAAATEAAARAAGASRAAKAAGVIALFHAPAQRTSSPLRSLRLRLRSLRRGGDPSNFGQVAFLELRRRRGASRWGSNRRSRPTAAAAAASEKPNGGGALAEIGAEIRLMYIANEGDMEGIRELLDSGVDVNFRDIDGRTALHVAACQGFADVVELLLKRGGADRSRRSVGSVGSTLGFDDHLLLRFLGFISWG
uniref:Uncharacterized protein n=1 Tax=Ananas comosus var. bracteatus TaxID=296719 RepID=A0A6V7PDA9_ANACO|nr:unnamed protein product [Ananas comosus var. bracteatus]